VIRFLKENYDNNLYQQLLDFTEGKIKGKSINDNLIYEVKNNGTVIIEFDNISEYLNLFDDVLADGEIDMIKSAFSHYSHYDFFDYYRAQDDWNEGYLLRNVNGESEALLRKLLSVLAPNLITPMFTNHDDSAWKTASKLLEGTFNREVDYIITDYSDNMNNGANDRIKEEVEKDLCRFFDDKNIFKIGYCFRKYVTNVKSLIKLYKETEAYQDDLKGMLKNYVEKVGLNINGSYYDSIYDEMWSYFDGKRFVNDSKKHIQDMLDKLEDSDIFYDIEEYKKITRQISKLEFDTWDDLPKDKTMVFRINGVNPENNLIRVDVRNKSTYKTLNYEVDYEQLNLILFHPELFRKFYN